MKKTFVSAVYKISKTHIDAGKYENRKIQHKIFDLKRIAQFISCLTHTHTHTNENSSFVYTRDSMIAFFKDPQIYTHMHMDYCKYYVGYKGVHKHICAGSLTIHVWTVTRKSKSWISTSCWLSMRSMECTPREIHI